MRQGVAIPCIECAKFQVFDTGIRCDFRGFKGEGGEFDLCLVDTKTPGGWGSRSSFFRRRLLFRREIQPPDACKAIAILKTQVSFWVYLAGCLALAVHLLHGFQSAFQTLGLNHPKYNGLIRGLGTVVMVLVALGFALFPIWAMFK